MWICVALCKAPCNLCTAVHCQATTWASRLGVWRRANNTALQISVTETFGSWGLAKLRNIAAETLFPLIVYCVAKLGNTYVRSKVHPPRSNSVFYLIQKHFLVSKKQNLLPRHMFPALLNRETFASTTIFPGLDTYSLTFARTHARMH